MARLFLSSIHCEDTNETRDEPFLQVDGETVWSAKKVTDGDSFRLHETVQPISFLDTVIITLWEEDSLNNDKIGSVRINATDSVGRLQSFAFREASAYYTLYYYVLADQAEPPITSTLHFEKVECKRTEDFWDGDELYIKVNSDVVWGPNTVNRMDVVDLHSVEPIAFVNRAIIKFYDEDSAIDDFLGAGYARASQAGQGSQVLYFTQDGAYYILTYKVT